MTVTRTKHPRIIVALDFSTASQALDFVSALDPRLCRLKVGKELFLRGGPALVQRLINVGYDVFLDLKLHDIPNTVAQACKAAADLGVWMLTVHALGGRAMLEAARKAIADGEQRPRLVAVTVLTSLDIADLRDIGLSGTLNDNVLRLGGLALSAGLDGLVCSAHEAGLLRQTHGPNPLLVTPGIRPPGSAADDQKRVMTPYDAISNGADYLVVGRAVTGTADPLHVLEAIEAEIGSAIAVHSSP